MSPRLPQTPAVKLGSAGGIYQPRPMPAFSAAGATASWASRKRCCRLKLTSECLGAWFWNNRRAADNFGHPVGCCEHIFRNLRAAGGRAQLSRAAPSPHDLVKRRAQGLLPFLVNLACQRGEERRQARILLGVFAGNQPQVGVLERGCIGNPAACGAQIGQDQVAVAFWLGPVWLELQAPSSSGVSKIDNFSIWRVRGIFSSSVFFPRGAAIMRGAWLRAKRAQGHAPERRAGKQDLMGCRNTGQGCPRP